MLYLLPYEINKYSLLSYLDNFPSISSNYTLNYKLTKEYFTKKVKKAIISYDLKLT